MTLAGPPYPRTPPEHIPWRTVTQTKMQTYTKIRTHTRTWAQMYRQAHAQRTQDKIEKQRAESIKHPGIGISSPKQGFYMFDVPMLR